jgi:alkylation response protein AidB-like acyl-CoA dehydrogenase
MGLGPKKKRLNTRKVREDFGTTIAQYQGVTFRLAESASEL